MRSATATVALLLVALTAAPIAGATQARPRVAIVNAGAESWARSAVGRTLGTDMLVLDPSLVDAAVSGAGYDGSTNLTLDETRRLALTVGAEVLVFVTSSVVEREADNDRSRWDGFVGLLLADGASGRLERYKGVRVEAGSREQAEKGLEPSIAREVGSWADAIAALSARRERGGSSPNWDPAAEDLMGGDAESNGLRPPRFFRKPAPEFTADADRMHAVATVDLVVQFNADGTYGPIVATRWASYGLVDEAIRAVRAQRFWPAERAGKAVSARALLRYNFRFRDR